MENKYFHGLTDITKDSLVCMLTEKSLYLRVRDGDDENDIPDTIIVLSRDDSKKLAEWILKEL